MQRKIKFRDLDSVKYKAITVAGGVLMALAALSWILQWTSYLQYICAGLSVMAFTVLSMDSFTSSNAVSYGKKSITIKLLGSKTTGFLFSDVQEIRLQEQGLFIGVQGMEDLKLSRKRYTDQSLEQLHSIIKEKTI